MWRHVNRQMMPPAARAFILVGTAHDLKPKLRWQCSCLTMHVTFMPSMAPIKYIPMWYGMGCRTTAQLQVLRRQRHALPAAAEAASVAGYRSCTAATSTAVRPVLLLPLLGLRLAGQPLPLRIATWQCAALQPTLPPFTASPPLLTPACRHFKAGSLLCCRQQQRPAVRLPAACSSCRQALDTTMLKPAVDHGRRFQVPYL